jgi:hypothetical protein
MEIVTKRGAGRFAAGTLVSLYMAVIAFTAHASGVSLLLFPELAALSHDVIARPRGRWASQPWRLILTPTATAVLGIFVTRHAQYSAVDIVLIVLLSLGVIKLLRSSIGPAISAGVLPLVLGERSWIYPLAIFADLSSLVAVLLLWQRFGPHRREASEEEREHSTIVDALEALAPGRFWMVTLIAFVLVLGGAAQLSGLRFLLFPPLIVMAYEIFGHAEVPRWMARPVLFPVVCLLTAATGTLAVHAFGASFVGVAVAVMISIGILQIFRVHMPPALAVGMLPFVMTAPDVRYPISVTLGTTALTLCALGYKHLPGAFRQRGAAQTEPTP